MVCRVRYLNSAGIHMRDIPRIDALARAFPAEWLLCTSLRCFPLRSAFVVTDERALLLEIKSDNGILTANGDQWVLNGGRRFRSPVDLVSEKARKVKGILGSTVPGFSKYSVDSRVAMPGPPRRMVSPRPSSHRYYRCTKPVRSPTLGSVRSSWARPYCKKAYAFEAEFDRAMRNPRLWQPAEGSWEGYRVVEEGVVVTLEAFGMSIARKGLRTRACWGSQ